MYLTPFFPGIGLLSIVISFSPPLPRHLGSNDGVEGLAAMFNMFVGVVSAGVVSACVLSGQPH